MLDQEKVRDLFEYRDGILYWKIKPANNAEIGSVAGSIQSNGYCYISIDSKLYRRSRLVFLYHHGYIPEYNIDHKNRRKLDDRIENLREVTQQCNSRNTGNFSNNISGVKGVSWCKRYEKWHSQIGLNKKRYNLGYYDDFDEAVCHRLAAEQCLNWSGCDNISPAYKYVMEK